MRKVSYGRRTSDSQRADALFWHFCDQHERAADLDAMGVLALLHDDGKVWAEHREAVVKYFVEHHPGRRPKTWWEFETPRMTPEECAKVHRWAWEGIAEPRKMISPDLTVIDSEFNIGHYAGIPYRITVRDSQCLVRCWFAGGKQSSESNEPGPMFESQASYLQRHNLMFPGEAERSDFRPEGYVNAQSFIPPWAK